LLTEAKPGANADDLRRYTDHLIEVFGPDRLMWGSDWPVLTIAQDYQSWVNISAQLLAELSVNDREKIWAGTATKFYRLGDN
jgi:L-fuconolactonase